MSNKNVTRRSFIAAASTIAGVTVSSALVGCAGQQVGEITNKEEGAEAGALPTTIPYTQYASGGIPTDLNAVILFESSNSTFTKYQVSFTSCTCRDAASNYSSVIYAELLNTKETANEAAIRAVTFLKNEGYTVGLWGDSDPIHDAPTYTREYMDEHFVQKLVEATKSEFDAWGGYGTQLERIEVDAVSGATVSTSNTTSLLQALFTYHTNKYYDSHE